MDVSFFFFNDTATTEIYTLSLHDALPISAWQRIRGRESADPARPGDRADRAGRRRAERPGRDRHGGLRPRRDERRDRKSTRLNSSHANISYAVFCLKKKNHNKYYTHTLHY